MNWRIANSLRLHLFVAVCISLMTATTAAALVRPMSLDRVAALAKLVVVGRVVNSYTSLASNAHMTITSFEVVVERIIVDDGTMTVGKKIVVAVPGGDAGGLHVDVEDAPMLTIGKTYLLFTRELERKPPFVGWTEGVFQRIQAADSGDDEYVSLGGQRLEINERKELIKGRNVIKADERVMLARSPHGAQRLDAPVSATNADGSAGRVTPRPNAKTSNADIGRRATIDDIADFVLRVRAHSSK